MIVSCSNNIQMIKCLVEHAHKILTTFQAYKNTFVQAATFVIDYSIESYVLIA